MEMKEQWRRDTLATIGGLMAVGAITVTLRAVQDDPNPTIAALLFLLVVLATATTAHLRVSIAISVIAMLVFNFFLLPPFYTLTIADPQNWVALFVFIVVAVIASQLSAAVRQRASEADSRKQEVTRLFDLSRDILLTTDSERAIADVARYVARRFELETIAICLPTVAGWELHQGAERSVEPTPEQLNQAFARLRGPLECDARQRAYGGHHVVRDHGTEATSFRFDSARSPLGFWRPKALIWISERSMPSEVSSRSPSSVPIFLPNERRPRRSVSEPTWRLRFSRRSATISGHPSRPCVSR